MTKKRLLRFSPYLTFLFCYGLVTIVGLIPGLLYGNEMGYWLLGSPLGISHFLFGLICSTITMFVANSIFYKKGEDKAA